MKENVGDGNAIMITMVPATDPANRTLNEAKLPGSVGVPVPRNFSKAPAGGAYPQNNHQHQFKQKEQRKLTPGELTRKERSKMTVVLSTTPLVGVDWSEPTPVKFSEGWPSIEPWNIFWRKGRG